VLGMCGLKGVRCLERSADGACVVPMGLV
jgi:hypothetical protein